MRRRQKELSASPFFFLLGHKVKVLYVSGKYRDERGPYYVLQNVMRARQIGCELWQMGFCAIVPHMNTLLLEGLLDDPTIIAGDLELVKRSNGLIVCPGWETSKGTRLEWRQAYIKGRPIFFYDHPSDLEALRWWGSGKSYDEIGHAALQDAKQFNSIEEMHRCTMDLSQFCKDEKKQPQPEPDRSKPT